MTARFNFIWARDPSIVRLNHMCASQHLAESGTKDIPRLRQPSEVYMATETHHLIWLPDESQDFQTLTDADSGNTRWCDNMLKTLSTRFTKKWLRPPQ